MTFKDYKEFKREQMLVVTKNIGISALLTIVLIFGTILITGKQAAAEAYKLQTDERQQARDMMVMLQNAAVWTDQGLVVLQGNRLLHYSADMQLRHTVVLPISPASKAKLNSVSQDSTKSEYALPVEFPALRSSVVAQIIAAEDGLIVVRNQQLIRLDRDFKVTGQATLPDLQKLSTAEMGALFPNSLLLLDTENQLIGQTQGPVIENQQ